MCQGFCGSRVHRFRRMLQGRVGLGWQIGPRSFKGKHHAVLFSRNGFSDNHINGIGWHVAVHHVQFIEGLGKRCNVAHAFFAKHLLNAFNRQSVIVQ